MKERFIEIKRNHDEIGYLNNLNNHEEEEAQSHSYSFSIPFIAKNKKKSRGYEMNLLDNMQLQGTSC